MSDPLSRLRTALLAVVAAVFSLSGCSPLDLINHSVPKDHFLSETGISYGPGERLKLDVHRPVGEADVPRKVVVFFYGGRWQTGSRNDYLFVAEALTRHGIVTVIPDYRLYPEVRFPTFVEDGAQALEWTRRYIADYGGDPESIYLAGHSSGAYIAAMLNLDERFGDSRGIQGMVGLAGPYDFLPLGSSDLQAIFDTAAGVESTQPITHVDGTEPPMLLLSGADDRIVDPGNSSRLAERVRQHGGQALVRFYPDTGHRLLVGAIAAPLRRLAPTLDDMVRFINDPG